MKIRLFRTDDGLAKATKCLDRAYTRFMTEMWAFHLWWETYLRQQTEDDMQVQKIKCK